MKSAIILHGMPDESEEGDPSTKHWIPWLKGKLESEGYQVAAPELPNAHCPSYEAWKAVFESLPRSESTALVGHSCGAGFLARWLSENKASAGKVVFVAPWMDPPPRTLSNGFFEFVPDPEAEKRAASVSTLVSDDDDEDIHESVHELINAWPSLRVVTIKGKGHFTVEDMGTEEFPELLAEILD